MTYELLLVDDEPCILESLAEWLTDDDINVTKAKNGRDGLNLLKEKRFDIVVSDINMPVMDGVEMFFAAKAAGVFIPHIFFSANHDQKLIQSLKAAGATFVQKPHNERLSMEINSVLTRSEFMLSKMPASVDAGGNIISYLDS